MGPHLATVDRGTVGISALGACSKLSLIKSGGKMLYGPGNERSFILSKKNKLTSASHPDTLKRDWKNFEPEENSDFSPSGQHDKLSLLQFFQSNIHILSKKKPAGQGCETRMCLRRWWWRGKSGNVRKTLFSRGRLKTPGQNGRKPSPQSVQVPLGKPN